MQEPPLQRKGERILFGGQRRLCEGESNGRSACTHYFVWVRNFTNRKANVNRSATGRSWSRQRSTAVKTSIFRPGKLLKACARWSTFGGIRPHGPLQLLAPRGSLCKICQLHCSMEMPKRKKKKVTATVTCTVTSKLLLLSHIVSRLALQCSRLN